MIGPRLSRKEKKHFDRIVIDSSCINSVCGEYANFIARMDIDSIGIGSQKRIYKALIELEPPFDFAGMLSIKCSRLLEFMPIDSQISNLISIYSRASRSLAFAITFTHLRVICNHWCTKSRFGIKNSPCIFSCGHCNDRITHVVTCNVFWQLFFNITNISPFGLPLESILLFTNDYSFIGEDKCCLVLIGIHICSLCFNSCRHGRTIDARLVQHHLSHFCRTHSKIGKKLSELRIKHSL